MIKAIATDLDGTLLNSKKEISQENIDTLRDFYKKGYEILVVTGRSYSATKPVVEKIGIPMSVVCYNGAKVVDSTTDEVIFEKPLSEDIVRKLIEISHSKKIHLNLYQNDIWYVENSDSAETFLYKRNSGLTPEKKAYNSFDDLTMTKALFINENSVLKELEKTLRETFGDEVYLAFSQEDYLEVLNKEVNKGLTLKNVLKEKNIDISECIAFGDAGNDLEMISVVGYGVAMENAHSCLKDVAKYTAPSNEDSGVSKFLKSFIK